MENQIQHGTPSYNNDHIAAKSLILKEDPYFKRGLEFIQAKAAAGVPAGAQRTASVRAVNLEIANLTKFLSISSRNNAAVKNGFDISRSTVADYIIKHILNTDPSNMSKPQSRLMDAFAARLIALAKVRSELGMRTKEWFHHGHTLLPEHVNKFITTTLHLRITEVPLKEDMLAELLLQKKTTTKATEAAPALQRLTTFFRNQEEDALSTDVDSDSSSTSLRHFTPAYGYHCTSPIRKYDMFHKDSQLTQGWDCLRSLIEHSSLVYRGYKKLPYTQMKLRLANLAKFLSVASRQNLAARNRFIINKDSVTNYIISKVLLSPDKRLLVPYVKKIELFAEQLIIMAKVRSEIGMRVREFIHADRVTHSVEKFLHERLFLGGNTEVLNATTISTILAKNSQEVMQAPPALQGLMEYFADEQNANKQEITSDLVLPLWENNSVASSDRSRNSSAHSSQLYFPLREE